MRSARSRRCRTAACGASAWCSTASTSTGISTTIRATTATSTRTTTGRTTSHERRRRAEALALGTIVGWTTFAFGGVYPTTILPAAIGCAALALTCRSSILQGSLTRLVDLWSLVAIGAMLLQTIPLPRAVVHAIDPASEAVRRALLLVDHGGARPLSLDVSSTLAAVLLFAGVWLFFATARAIFHDCGARTVVRMIAVIGLVLSALALAQSATARGLMYWRWRPVGEGPEPFGPFVNRNHFGTWAIMAIPLLAGYLIAHAAAHGGPSTRVS